MTVHSVVIKEKVQATRKGGIFNLVHTADLDNGAVCFVGGKVDGERDLFNLEVPATATLGTKKLVLIASDEVIIDTKDDKYTFFDFYNKAGREMKGYTLSETDAVSISAAAFDGTPAVGKYVVAQNASTKLLVADAPVGGSLFAGKIIEIKTRNGVDFVAFMVEQA